MNSREAERAFKTHERIKAITDVKNSSSLALGEYLYKMRENDGFLAVTGEGGTFSQYLADPEIKLAHSTAYRYIAVYSKYVIELGMSLKDLEGIDVISLSYITKFITKKNKEEWLAKAKALSRSDLQREGKYPDVDVMKCRHKFKPSKEKCPKCGEIRNVK